MKNFLANFFPYFWLTWLLMLVIVDPIASYLGGKYNVGDNFTDTHFLVGHISMNLRIAILAWLAYHFIWLHANS